MTDPAASAVWARLGWLCVRFGTFYVINLEACHRAGVSAVSCDKAANHAAVLITSHQVTIRQRNIVEQTLLEVAVLPLRDGCFSMSLCNWHTKSMQWSLYWEASSCSAGQEIPHIIWNQKVYDCIHKSSPPVPILSQMNPDHDPHPVSWRFILIQFCLRLVHAGGLFPFGFPTKTPCVSVSCVLPKVCPVAVCTFLLSHVQPSALYRSVNTGSWNC